MPTSSHPSIAKLQTEVREWFPSLSRAQANVLGEMAYAMLMTDGCGMTRMSSYMAELLGQPMNTLRQKYREIYYEKEAKAGVKNRQNKRREIVPEELFADLLRGVRKRVGGGENAGAGPGCQRSGRSFYGALHQRDVSRMWDESGLDDAKRASSGGMAASLGTDAASQLADVVPADWNVLVMADRGLYAAWLYQAIQANGWHPFLRVKKDLSFRAQGEEAFGAIGGRVKRTGREWKGSGEWSEKGDRMRGTVLVRWEQGYEEAICVVSDLPAESARTAWYQMRFWIEDEYKDGKRGWFHWEQTKMTNPQRASRLWLVLGIVLQKAILLGGQLEAQEQKSQKRQPGRKRRRGRPALPQGRPRGREQSVLLRGIMALRAAESGGKRLLPNGQVRAEPLPSRLYAVRRVCKSHQMKKKRREEKKRNKQSAQARARREQRAQERAAKQAAIQARRRENQEQRAAKQAAIQANRERRKAIQRPPVNQNAPLCEPQEAQAGSKGSQVHLIGAQSLVAKRTEGVPLLRLRNGRLQAPGKPEPPLSAHPNAPVSEPQHLTMPPSPRGEPLLRLSRGRLQPPHRLVRKEIRPKRGLGPPCGVGP